MERDDRRELQRQLAALSAGDRQAFHPVFVRAWPLLRGFAARHLPHDQAEDAAQQALLNVFRRAGEFDPARDALTWMLSIAGYEVRSQRKRQARRREVPADALAERAAAGPSPETSALARSFERALAASLAALRPQDAQTLLAYARAEPPALPAATFRKRVERALGRLRLVWRDRHGVD